MWFRFATKSTFFAWLDRFVGKATKQGDGTYRIEIPARHVADPRTAAGFIRIRDGYAFLTVIDVGVIAVDRLPTPGPDHGGRERGAGFGAVFTSIAFRSLIAKPLSGGIGSSRACFAANAGRTRGGIMPMFGMWAMMMGLPLIDVYPYLDPIIQDGQDATLHLRFDRQRLDLSYEVTVSPRADSAFATQVAGINLPESRFAAWTGPNAAVACAARLSIPEELRKSWAGHLEEKVIAECPRQ